MPSRRRTVFNGTLLAAGILLLILAAVSWRFGQPNFDLYLRWGDGIDLTAPVAFAVAGGALILLSILSFLVQLIFAPTPDA